MSFGYYRGIDPGTDSHLFRACRSVIIEIWGREDADDKAVWMGRKIPEEEGRRAK